MMSECSSAVLELNDADAEDTEAPSVTEEPNEGAPLIMEHGYDIAVKVDAPMKQLSTLETFVTYRVRCVCARWPAPPAVRRRYNHFKVLHRRLCAAHPLTAAPPLPPLHSARQQLDRYSPAFVAVRALALHAFLDRVAKHPILTHSEDFRIFVTTPDEEFEKVFKSENSALNLWGLGGALSGGADSKPANGARVKDPEFSAAADYLHSLQHKLTALCALTTKLYKGSAALATEHMGMKRACDAWSTQAGGRAARAAGGCGAGAAAAASAPRRAPLRHRAALPLLAAYAAAHADKIRQRDAIHAAQVAGNNTGELHNRLEQASEALRSELSDWIPKTHSEIKSLLLDMADRQLSVYSQTLAGWEHALKLSTEANIDELFKTVSKTAVQNLSPSKCRVEGTPTETERDFDDLDYSNDESDFDNCDRIDRDSNSMRDLVESSKNANSSVEAGACSSKNGEKDSVSRSDSKMSKLDAADFEDELKVSNLERNDSKSDSKMSKLDLNDSKSDSKMSKLDLADFEDELRGSNLECNDSKSDSKMSKLDSAELEAVSKLGNGSKMSNFELESNMSKLDSDSKISKLESKESELVNVTKMEVVSDPLQNFSDVDLSS